MIAILALFACKDDVPTQPTGLCPELDDPVIELTQGVVWGMSDGDPIAFGIPPQGGAPYAPFDVRLIGVAASNDGYTVTTEAWRRSDGELVGSGEYLQRFVCANVGENEGTRFASEFHMRFFGFEPPDLADEEVDVAITVTPASGEPVVAEFWGPLDWVLGPMP
ncbi:MAG: hypothetical protein H6737_27645 [Alphaproteobacteria bacterium]|nr:hypothetical protein [Alphaproteobacteria bacterium]